MVGRILISFAVAVGAVADIAAAAHKRFRHPVAIAISPDARVIYTANRRSRTLSVLDAAKQIVISELELNAAPSSLAIFSGGRKLLITDEKNHQLLLLSRGDSGWKITSRVKVASHPVDVVINPREDRCYVSSLWSRTVTTLQTQPLKVLRTTRLPFEPRKLCLLENGRKLVAADSFDGRLSAIDTDTGKLIATHRVPGHNIRGLAASTDGTRLLSSQQTLNSLARSTLDDVHWGNMFSNLLFWFPLKAIGDSKADLVNDKLITHLGRPSNAAGDPGAISVRKNRIAIVLSGVNETLVGANLEAPLMRVPVGKRPVDVTISPDGRYVFVANQFSDSVTIIDAEKKNRTTTISLGDQPAPKLADLGEELFFNARLSHDGWMSCHSCHTDGHTNGRFNDNLSDDSFGTPKRVLSLLGVSKTAPWAWTGKIKSLEEQVKNSVQKTMRGKAPSEKQVRALVAYMKTLAPPPALQPETTATPKQMTAIKRGRKLFADLKCSRCHTPPSYTSRASYDVGLADAGGNEKFNPPSLLGVGRREELFHDGRAKSLADVFSKHRHQLPRKLTHGELDALLEFLKSR